ncbi:MAG: efflux RND transporter periplasmic adaptor subunit [Acidobacteria bacterium]|nr:efflux RND transporter periplasmic adaptor subunit [Acidobacteriota bacterium]
MNQDFVRFVRHAPPRSLGRAAALLCAACALLFSACSGGKADPAQEAPPPANVQADFDPANFTVNRRELFPLAEVAARKTVPAVNSTGVVQADITRAVPVISLAAGRVIEIRARLGDAVKKGQVLLRIQSNDVSGAFQTYIKAQNDERLAHLQLDRVQTLYDHGATSKAALEQAENGEEDAKADLNAASEQLRLLGIDKQHPSGIVDVVAPISGVITDQQVTNSSGVQGLSGPSPFTISDLSYVWIVCDVYENDLDAVRVGQYADIRLNAYPNRVMKGRIDNILPVLDPGLRTAKVRIEVPNSGIMRVGMFVTATFYGKQPVVRAVVPAAAVLHLHDRDWVYAYLGNGRFKRQEITSGAALSGNTQEVVSGLKPGDRVVSNALELENTVEQ